MLSALVARRHGMITGAITLCLVLAQGLCTADVLSSSAAQPGHVTTRIDDPDKMRAALISLIPVGTEAGKAAAIMRSEGFSVSLYKDESVYIEDTTDASQQHPEPLSPDQDARRTRNHADFLLCRRDDGMLVTTNWIVTLVLDKGKVSELHMMEAFTGP